MTIGSRKTVPPRALRMVPFGDNHTAGDISWERRELDRTQHTLLELELLNTGFIWGDGGTLDTDRVLLDGLGGINGDLVVGLITILESEIVVLEVDVEVWVDELVLDVLPDDAGHLITVQLHHWVLDLDLLESRHLSELWESVWLEGGCNGCSGCSVY